MACDLAELCGSSGVFRVGELRALLARAKVEASDENIESFWASTCTELLGVAKDDLRSSDIDDRVTNANASTVPQLGQRETRG
jgi:hypothetical protein